MHWMFRVLVLFLITCASPIRAAWQPDNALPSGEGAVLLTVSVDYLSFANQNALPGLIPQLTVERLDDAKPKQFVLRNRLHGLHMTRAYAGSLPPGRYRVYDIMGSKCRIICAKGGRSKPGPEHLAEFVIEAGRVRYLGSVLVSVRSPVKPQKIGTVYWGYTRQPDPVAGRRLLDGLYPELAAAATGDMLVGWETQPEDVAIADAALDHIRRENSGLLDPTPYGDNGLQFGALNGVIKRASGNSLRLIDTGSVFTIKSALQGSDGRILAGGEASTLLYSSDDGRTWQDVGAGLPYGIVLQIRSIGGDEVVFLLHHGTNAALYRGRFGDTSWTQVGDWPMEFKFWTGLPGMPPEMQLQGRRVAITLPSKSGVFVDLDTGDSHMMNPPGSLAMFTYTADGVMRCICFRSIAANPWESRDLGKTWQDSPFDRWMLLPAFRDASHAFSYKGAMFNKEKMAVMQTRDGGATWVESRPPTPGGWWRPYYTADGRRMVLSGFVAVDDKVLEGVYWSDDEGAQWVEWDNEGIWLHAKPPAS
jgi:photosystem II stability/assembly factor-like uncharacterized protein